MFVFTVKSFIFVGMKFQRFQITFKMFSETNKSIDLVGTIVHKIIIHIHLHFN